MIGYLYIQVGQLNALWLPAIILSYIGIFVLGIWVGISGNKD